MICTFTINHAINGSLHHKNNYNNNSFLNSMIIQQKQLTKIQRI